MPASRRVLLIEHDACVRASMARALAGRGADVVLASDLAEARASLDDGVAPAVVLVDLRRAAQAAHAFVTAMRADPRLEDVPVITMTAEGGARRGRGDAPFDVDDVLAIVLSLCEHGRSS